MIQLIPAGEEEEIGNTYLFHFTSESVLGATIHQGIMVDCAWRT